MAYKGGYAGGYADTIVPPIPTDDTLGWRYTPPIRETQLRTRIRYRLAIISNGAISHSDPEPISIGTHIGGDTTHHRHDLLAIGRIDSTTHHHHDSEHTWHGRTGGAGTIPDPDEWIVFL